MRRWEHSRVLVVGMGGLGCPASLAMAKAGLRNFTLVDSDCVELSNLHRQLWYTDQDLGRPKAEVSANRLRDALPGLQVEALVSRVDEANARELFSRHDLAIDGTDGVGSKFLLSDASVDTGTPLVYGGVLRLEGQAMVIDPMGPCLRCLFEYPVQATLPTCSQAGVMGSIAGVVGAMQALWGIQHLRDARRGGQLWIFDGSKLQQRIVVVSKAKDCVCRRAPGGRQAGAGA